MALLGFGNYTPVTYLFIVVVVTGGDVSFFNKRLPQLLLPS